MWCLCQLNEGHRPLQGGIFAADVLVGDSGIANPIAWRIVSSLAVKHKPMEDGSQPAAPGKLAAYAQFATKPTIVHIQRQPDKRAPLALSLLFAGLTLTPLLVLTWMLGQLGINFKVSTRCAPPLPDLHCRQGLNWCLIFAGLSIIRPSSTMCRQLPCRDCCHPGAVCFVLVPA